MNLDIIARLVQILRDSPELGAIEVRRGLFGAWSVVRVSRAGHVSHPGDHVVVTQAPGTVSASSPSSAPAGSAPGFSERGGGRAEAAGVPAAAPQLLEIKSPMVGTFYGAPQPGADPYVKVGSRVSTGQVVCIIEAMKIMNEIESEIQGVIKEVFLESAQPVEFGQTLFRVDPHG
jgi:acetyl-CoA carboxylase biotin carboxyl carrier protein